MLCWKNAVKVNVWMPKNVGKTTFIFISLLLYNRRKKEAREVRVISKKAKRLRGIKAKIFNKKRFKEKIIMKKM